MMAKYFYNLAKMAKCLQICSHCCSDTKIAINKTANFWLHKNFCFKHLTDGWAFFSAC